MSMHQQLSLLTPVSNQKFRVVYFDLETIKSAQEVGGWSYLSKMGMACGVCFDSIDNEYKVYEEKDVQALIDHLQRADLVVGFNHIRFDYPVLSGYTKFNFSKLNSFDILEDVSIRLGHRIKLDALVQATLNEKKSADGLQSLQWVKEGKMDLVKEYCVQDVKVTKDLFLFGVENGYVFYKQSGQNTSMQVNWNVEKLIEAKK